MINNEDDMNELFRFRYSFEKEFYKADVKEIPHENQIVYIIRLLNKQHRVRFGEELAISIFTEPTRGFGYSLPQIHDVSHESLMQRLYESILKLVRHTAF